MNPWAILGIILALSAIGAGIFTAGKRVERAATVERDRLTVIAAYKVRDEALAKVAELEAKNIKDIAEAESKANKEITDAHEERDGAIAAAGKRELRLTALCAANLNRTATQAGSIAREAAEREAAELRRAYAEPFIRLAGEADEITIERNEAVEILLKDREVCR